MSEIEDFMRVLKDWDIAPWQRQVVINLRRDVTELKAENEKLREEIVTLQEKAAVPR